MKEAREDQKVIQYIDSCIKKANEASVSKAAKIQVHNMTVTQQLMLFHLPQANGEVAQAFKLSRCWYSWTSEQGTPWGQRFCPLWRGRPYLGGQIKYYISMGFKQVSFVERASLSRRVPCRRFHCTSLSTWLTNSWMIIITKFYLWICVVCVCVQKFRVIPVDLSIGGAELTPTMKLKRKVIQEKYSDLTAEMYGEG